MAIRVARNSSMSDVLGEGDAVTTIHKIEGTVEEVQLFLFNDNPEKRYENVVLSIVDTAGTDESGWIALAKDVNGAPGDYVQGELNFGEISNSNTVTPFWMRIENAPVSDSVNKNDLVLKVLSTEFAL